MSPRLTNRDASPCKGFTLTELLVAVAIILVLMSLITAAASAARSSAKKSNTQLTINKLNTILMGQFRKYDVRSVDVSDSARPAGMKQTNGVSALAYRAWKIRRDMITADMPDRWTDVAYMASNPGQFKSPVQRTYIAYYNAANPKPTDDYAGAECLFMIIMQGGFADCLDCQSLASLTKGDKDADGAFEFWDDWTIPIGYTLWAPAYQPASTNAPFFSGARALTPMLGEDSNSNGLLDPGEDKNGNGRLDYPTPSLGMLPLIYSAGPDRALGLNRDEAATLTLGSNPVGRDCGNPDASPTSLAGGPTSNAGGARADNITNLDSEANP